MNLTPEQIEAIGKILVSVIAAFGAIVATVASAITGFYTLKNRRDLHIAFDRIRDTNGEPLQYRHDPAMRADSAKAPVAPASAIAQASAQPEPTQAPSAPIVTGAPTNGV